MREARQEAAEAIRAPSGEGVVAGAGSGSEVAWPRPPHSTGQVAVAVVITTSTSTFSRFPRCFGAWQQFVQRAARYRAHLAHCRAGTLRTCLQQWVWMKRLRASDGAKVTQLALCRRKAGERASGRPRGSLSLPPQHTVSHKLLLWWAPVQLMVFCDGWWWNPEHSGGAV